MQLNREGSIKVYQEMCNRTNQHGQGSVGSLFKKEKTHDEVVFVCFKLGEDGNCGVKGQTSLLNSD